MAARLLLPLLQDLQPGAPPPLHTSPPSQTTNQTMRPPSNALVVHHHNNSIPYVWLDAGSVPSGNAPGVTTWTAKPPPAPAAATAAAAAAAAARKAPSPAAQPPSPDALRSSRAAAAHAGAQAAVSAERIQLLRTQVGLWGHREEGVESSCCARSRRKCGVGCEGPLLRTQVGFVGKAAEKKTLPTLFKLLSTTLGGSPNSGPQAVLPHAQGFFIVDGVCDAASAAAALAGAEALRAEGLMMPGR